MSYNCVCQMFSLFFVSEGWAQVRRIQDQSASWRVQNFNGPWRTPKRGAWLSLVSKKRHTKRQCRRPRTFRDAAANGERGVTASLPRWQPGPSTWKRTLTILRLKREPSCAKPTGEIRAGRRRLRSAAKAKAKLKVRPKSAALEGVRDCGSDGARPAERPDAAPVI